MSFLFLAPAALAQPLHEEYRRLPAVELHGVELKTAIETLSLPAGLRYEIASGVKGVVTVSARRILPEDALLAVLGQGDVVWVIRNGTLFVAPSASGIASDRARRQEASADLRHETDPSAKIEALDVAEALVAVLRPPHFSFIVTAGVTGRVSLQPSAMGIDVGLQRIAQEANVTYRITGGVFTVSRRAGRPLSQ